MAVHQLLRPQLGAPDDAAHVRGRAGRREPSRLSQDRGRRRRRPGRVREPAGEDSRAGPRLPRSEEHTSELQSQSNLVCRLLLEKKKKDTHYTRIRWITLPAWSSYQWLTHIISILTV